MKKIIKFIFNRILGIFFLTISALSFVSLFSRSEVDPPYSSAVTNGEIMNSLGLMGSYFSGYTNELLGDIAYLITIFFLIVGFKVTIGIEVRLIIIRLFSLLLSMVLFCWLTFNLFSHYSLVGDVVSKTLFDQFELIFANKLFFFLLCFVILFIAVLLFVYGVSLKLNSIKKLILPIIQILLFVLKFLKISYVHKFFLRLLYIRKKFSSNTLKRGANAVHLNSLKKEPTIDRSKIPNTILNNKNSTKINVGKYKLPSVSLLIISSDKDNYSREFEKRNQKNMQKLESTLQDFNVTGKITSFKTGPIVTLFEFQPSAGIKSSKVISLADDIARSMSSMSARISSQPGKNAIGIEIPNEKKQNVFLGDLLNDEKFQNNNQGLILALGKNISGEKIYTNLENMPHLLIAGTTGSGKSVGINSMIMSLLFKYKPSECKFILIDPKLLELSVYENIPHLLTPVVTDPKKAVFALKWIVQEMENRYRLMSSAGVKNIKSFNAKITERTLSGKKLYREVQTGIDQTTGLPIIEKKEIPLEAMPLIIVVLDEMADLMIVAGKEVEQLIQRLSQMARASGIHLIAATQRPSVDVITGTIKANFPSRISYRVASKFDSRTILNEMGAEQLLGSGDMLFLENGANLLRLHGGYVSEKEIENVVNYINSQPTNEIRKDITDEIISKNNELNFNEGSNNIDVLYDQAYSVVIQHQKASTSFLQRHLQIGYNRAARIIEEMEKQGIISEANHVGKRSVLKKNI